MSLTITPTQLRRKKRKNKTNAIYIRFTENSRSRYRSTGIIIQPEFWDRDQKRITKAHSLSKELNQHLDIVLEGIKSMAQKLEKSSDLSIDALLDQLPDSIGINTILHQGKVYLLQFDQVKDYSAYRHFRVVLNDVERFIKKKNHTNKVNKLTDQWITSFQQFLANEKGNKNSTIRSKIRRLKRFVNWLRDQKMISFDPFNKVTRVKSGRDAGEKIYLSQNEIEAMKNLRLEAGSEVWHARNYFLYSFYNGGIVFSDLCRLTWENVSDGRLQYIIGSTGGEKSIAQIDPMENILKIYQKENSLQGYIFPILANDSKEKNIPRLISRNNVIVNNALKIIGKKIGTDKSISFEVSKHSFAHYAFSNGMRTGSLHFALGNKRFKTTINYLKSLDCDLFNFRMEEGRDEVIQEVARELEHV